MSEMEKLARECDAEIARITGLLFDEIEKNNRLRSALKPFAKYEMVMVGMSDTVSRRDYADCAWIAGFDGPNQPTFRHFKEAREALSLPATQSGSGK